MLGASRRGHRWRPRRLARNARGLNPEPGIVLARPRVAPCNWQLPIRAVGGRVQRSLSFGFCQVNTQPTCVHPPVKRLACPFESWKRILE